MRLLLAALPVALAAASTLLTASCASPPPGLWPPKPGEPVTRIIVSADAWHSMIALPDGDGFEEWGFAEKAWYLENRQGVGGVFRALCLPSSGIVEVSRVGRPYSERSREGGPKQWTFDLGADSLARLKDYLQRSRSSDVPVADEGWRKWYASAWDYCFCHTCHHWAANALWEAGVPVYSWSCCLPSGLWNQLDRVGSRER